MATITKSKAVKKNIVAKGNLFALINAETGERTTLSVQRTETSVTFSRLPSPEERAAVYTVLGFAYGAIRGAYNVELIHSAMTVVVKVKREDGEWKEVAELLLPSLTSVE